MFIRRKNGELSIYDGNILTEDSKRTPFLSYIFVMNINLAIILCVMFFVSPQTIDAGEIGTGLSAYEAELADERLLDYRFATLSIFEGEKPLTIEEMLPHPVYPDLSIYENSGYFSTGHQVTRDVWKHAYELYYSGLIHGATAGRQCTFFAQMWFYDIYGFNSSGNYASGDGAHFASRVYQTAVYHDENGELRHYFEYGDRPMTMGIVSIYSSAEGGHVICVDEVDYINGLITISEGNANGYGNCRIRETMSLDRFYALNPGYKVYVNPTDEVLELLNND